MNRKREKLIETMVFKYKTVLVSNSTIDNDNITLGNFENYD